MNTASEGSSLGKVSATGLGSILNGDTVLVGFSVALFLASVANATQWPVLHVFRFCGICTTLLSLAFVMLTGRELFSERRRMRTVMAFALLLAATILCLHGHVTVTVGY